MKKTLFLILLIGLGSRANAQLSNSNATAANQQSILTKLNSLSVSATVMNSLGIASGTVTANAGTNLNTSLLALESGGNLATVKTNTDNLALSQGSATSGQKGSLPLGAVTTGAPTYTTDQSSPLSLDTLGNLRVMATVSGTPNVNISAGTVTTVSTVTNLSQMGGQAISMGTGVRAAGTQRVTIATDDLVPTNQTQIGGVSVSTGNGVVGTGVQRVAIASDNTPYAVKIDQTTNGTTNAVQLIGSSTSTGGLTTSDSQNVPKVAVKASAGRLYGGCFFSNKASTQWIQIFNSASQPAANTAPTVPPIQLASGETKCIDYGVYGKVFSSGIYIANSTSATAYVNGTSDTWISVGYQ